MNKNQLKIFQNIPTLETERLLLSKISNKHLTDIFEYSKEPIVSKYLLWYPHKSLNDTRYQIRSVNKLYRRGEFYDWAIILKENKKMIGTCGFTDIDITNNKGEIGYVLNPKFWGKGIAAEAINKIISFGFEYLHLHRIEAKYIADNIRSKNVLSKCGIPFECTQKEAMLIKGDYRTINIHAILDTEYFNGSII